jgi:hypothetical protein
VPVDLEKKRARQRELYAANRPEVLKAARDKYALSPEEKRARCRVYNKTRWTKRRTESLAYHRQWKAKNEEKTLVAVCKCRAKKIGVPFNLTVSDIVYPENCPVLVMKLERRSGRLAGASPSLDRLIPSLGYVSGNVRVISQRANTLKSNATVREMELVLAYMRSIEAKGG